MQVKKIPLRMCIGCGVSKPKKELIRIVKSADGVISIDRTGKQNGRGAYICNNVECLKKVQKSKRLNNSFGMPIDKEIYDLLLKDLMQSGE